MPLSLTSGLKSNLRLELGSFTVGKGPHCQTTSYVELGRILRTPCLSEEKTNHTFHHWLCSHSEKVSPTQAKIISTFTQDAMAK